MNKNNILYMTVVIVALICFSPVYFLIRDVVALVKADKYFAVPEYCSTTISIQTPFDGVQNITATYYGDNAEHYCKNTYELQKESLKPYSATTSISLNYIRQPVLPEICSRVFPETNVAVKVTSNSSEFGKMYCEGLNK